MPLPYLCNVNLRDENLRSYKKKITGLQGSKNFNRNATQERTNYQLSTVNYQLSTINCQLSTKITMAIKVNARETELKFGKEATYHSAMIWKMNAESLANKTDLRRSLFVDYYKAMRREGWLLLLDEDRPVAIGLLGLGEYLVSL